MALSKCACKCDNVDIYPGEVCNYQNAGMQLAALPQCNGRCYKHNKGGKNYEDVSALKSTESTCKHFIKASDVDILTNIITFNNHGYAKGDRVRFKKFSSTSQSTAIGGLTFDQNYFD